MDTIYFNWDELRLKAKGDPAGIIILTYGLTKSYNVSTSSYLMKKLNINQIAQFLFARGILKATNNKVKVNYVTKEAQSYFKYDKFSKEYQQDKKLYLRALSMRPLDDVRNFIPRILFNNIAFNPFLKVTNDKIEFIYE